MMLKHLVIVALVLFLAGCGGGSGGGGGGSASGDEPLRVGLIPNENPEEVEAEYQPLEDYLKKELGREVELSVPTTYNAVV
ncbi:MAG: PhnD/SsuA/transferrin family substrate-binding protein, partial [Rubrobacter sp.]|nr:PhnD/SsuA/transferrin family substrate-binding protein [Rubrobacter sp.]